MDPHATEPGVTAGDVEIPTGSQPTKIHVGMYVDRIIELSVKDARWTVDFYIWFDWRGDAVASCEGFQIIDGSIDSRVREVDHKEDNEHYERYRVQATISKAFDVSRFPRDDHLLSIHVEHPELQRRDLLFVADEDNSGVSSRVQILGYAIRGFQIVEKPHSYKTTRGDPRLPKGTKSTYSQCRLGIAIDRPDWGIHFKMFQSLYVAVAVALLAMFIKPTHVDPRFGLGIGGLFAAVANSYVTSSMIPDTGVLTLADVINGLGIGMILLTVMQSTISLYIADQLSDEHLSRRFDQASFAILAAGYAALNVFTSLAASV